MNTSSTEVLYCSKGMIKQESEKLEDISSAMGYSTEDLKFAGTDRLCYPKACIKQGNEELFQSTALVHSIIEEEFKKEIVDETYSLGEDELHIKEEITLQENEEVSEPQMNDLVNSYEGCKECGKKIDAASKKKHLILCKYFPQLVGHVKTNEKPKPRTKNQQISSGSYKCDFCPYVTNRAVNLHRHGVKHDEEKLKRIFTCANCSYVTYRKDYLSMHMKRHGNRKKWHDCNICDYKTRCKDYLMKHVLRLHIDNNHKFHCTYCESDFKSKVSLDNHIVQTHPDYKELVTSKLHKCGKCSFVTTLTTHLKRHMLRHKTNKCPECDYKTFSPLLYKTHLKKHKKVEPVIFCTVCSVKCRRRGSYYNHILKHHYGNKQAMNEITHTINLCQYCSYKSVVKNNFERHLENCKGKR